MSEHIKNMLVLNFRGVKELDIALKPITIFVGRNNTGKSSALEALSLALSSTNGFINLINRENLLDNIISFRGGVESLIYKDEKSSKIEITFLNNNRIELNLLRGNYIHDAPEGIRKILYQFINSKAEEIFEREMDILKDRIESYETKYSGLKEARPNYYIDRIRRYTEKLEKMRKSKSIYIQDHFETLLKNLSLAITTHYNDDIVEIRVMLGGSESERRLLSYLDEFDLDRKVGWLVKTFSKIEIPFFSRLAHFVNPTNILDMMDVEKQVEIIEMLRKVIPYFYDYRNGNVVFKYGEYKEIIPLEATADGFQVFVNMYLPILIGIKIMIIEEPEIHLHPGLIERLSEVITYSVKTNNIQYILSTHSLELIEMILEKSNAAGLLSKVGIVRLYKMPDGHIDYEILDGNEAITELKEIGGDLRGP